jgi:hypothetical protein
MRAKVRYEKRVVAFLDLLGFADLVVASAKDHKRVNDIREVLHLVDRLRPQWSSPDLRERQIAGLEATAESVSGHPPWPNMGKVIVEYMARREYGIAFSDTLVLSQQADGVGILALFWRTQNAVVQLLLRGILVRGAIVSQQDSRCAV